MRHTPHRTVRLQSRHSSTLPARRSADTLSSSVGRADASSGSFGLAATVALCSTIGLALGLITIAQALSDFTAIAIVLAIFSVLLLALYIGGIVLVITPWLAVCVRRLHDTNRSGLWLVAALFVPFVPLVVLYFCSEAGTPGSNQYGPNPYGGVDDPPVAPAGPGWLAPG